MILNKRMSIDGDYTFIIICPNTKQRLTHHDTITNKGICPYCNHNSGTNVVHKRRIFGKWHRSRKQVDNCKDEYFVTSIMSELQRIAVTVKCRATKVNILHRNKRKIYTKQGIETNETIQI